MMLPDNGTAQYKDETNGLDIIEVNVSPYGEALIILDLRIVQPSLATLSQNREKRTGLIEKFSPPLLAAVYILAPNYWRYSAESTEFKRPDVSALVSLPLRYCVIYSPKILGVEAGMLLLQRPKGTSWSLTAQILAVGQDLGLHQDCSTWTIPSWERELRK